MTKKVMFVGAHQDDMQGAAAGLLAKMQKHLTMEGLEATLTNGAGGHCEARYLRDPQALVKRRLAEARAGAKLVGFDYKLLTDLRGRQFPDSDLQITRDSKGAVWNAIRQFQPDLLLTLPVNDVSDCFGMHNDHTHVGEIVKRIAYLIAAPFAFPEWYTQEYLDQFADDQPLPYVKPPIIVTTHDGYSGQIDPDLIIDITEEADVKAEAFNQHESQVQEWLPWVGRYEKPKDVRELKERLVRRSRAIAEKHGLKDGYYEAYTITNWGTAPTLDEIKTFFPGDALNYSLAEKKLALFG